MSIDGLNDCGAQEGPGDTGGPGRRAAPATWRSPGHYLAAHAAFEALEAGGNAIDAGCAGGIALGVLQSELVNVAGVAPIIVYLAETREVVTISGLGTWPAATDPELFRREHDSHIPEGILRTVVPAAPERLDHGARALRHDELRGGRGPPPSGSPRKGSSCTR